MNQHTPGPWHVTPTPARPYRPMYFLTVAGESRFSVDGQPGEAAIADLHSFLPNQPEVEANARLIAAAPDLLNIARTIVAICESGDTNLAHLACDENSPLVGEARAAIAKAEEHS